MVANIGYGIFMIFAGPILVATLLFAIGALVRAWHLQRRPPFLQLSSCSPELSHHLRAGARRRWALVCMARLGLVR